MHKNRKKGLFMNRMPFLFVICGLVLVGNLFSQSTESSKNLVENPSFEETDAKGNLLAWEAVKNGYQISPDVFRSGKQSMLLKGEKIVGGVRRNIDVPEPGCKLRFKANLYIKSFSSGVLKPIHVSFISAGKTYYRPQVNLFPDQKSLRKNVWVEYTAELDLSGFPDVEKIVLWCLGYAHNKYGSFTGEVYIDDLSLERF